MRKRDKLLISALCGTILGLSTYDIYESREHSLEMYDAEVKYKNSLEIMLNALKEQKKDNTDLTKQIQKLNSDIVSYQNSINGMKDSENTYLKGHSYLVLQTMNMEATAYSDQEPLEIGGGVTTASGTHVTEGRTIAVDPTVIPLGSLVHIESDYPNISGFYIAEDTGGAIKGNRVDIYIRSLDRVKDFGRRSIKVQVIKGM